MRVHQLNWLQLHWSVNIFSLCKFSFSGCGIFNEHFMLKRFRSEIFLLSWNHVHKGRQKFFMIQDSDVLYELFQQTAFRDTIIPVFWNRRNHIRRQVVVKTSCYEGTFRFQLLFSSAQFNCWKRITSRSTKSLLFSAVRRFKCIMNIWWCHWKTSFCLHTFLVFNIAWTIFQMTIEEQDF